MKQSNDKDIQTTKHKQKCAGGREGRFVMKKRRIYLDTSVFGGCFDEEFAKDSLCLFEQIRRGYFVIVLSDMVLFELDGAPPNVAALVEGIPHHGLEKVVTDDECRQLQQAYLDAGVVGPASAADALHIALATIAGADIIISWNFKHIVHFDKIAGYHSVNMRMGYAQIGIFSPKEVIRYEDDER